MNLSDDELLKLLNFGTVKKDGCWLYTYSTFKSGYGRLKINRKTYRTHRLSAYLFLDFALDNDLFQVNHIRECLNRNCWNPEHLYIGTHLDNQIDKSSRYTHCPQGHEYIPENTFTYKRGLGTYRICKEYARLGSQRRRDNKGS